MRTQRQLLQGGKVGLLSLDTPFCPRFPSSPKQEVRKVPLDRCRSQGEWQPVMPGLGAFVFKVNSVLVEGTRLGLERRAGAWGSGSVVGRSRVAAPVPPGFALHRRPFKASRNEWQLQTSFLFSAKSQRGPFPRCSRAEASGLGCLR